MAKSAAISAVFVDYKRIKGRKVHQIIFEVPSETWQATYDVLGEPSIDGSEWFAIARMDGVQAQKTKGGKIAQRAGILCNEGAFVTFAHEKGYDDPATMIYALCGIKSRAHLDHDEVAASAFRELDLEYTAWRLAA